MAKSIFEILDSLETETSVPAVGKNIEHTIPRSQFPTAEQFESAELLEQWARETGLMHVALQSGVQKRLIDIRAIFKSEKKGETWTPEAGQKKVNESEWTITERPKAGKSVDKARYNDCMNMIANMCVAKMPTDQIKAIAIPVYGEELVNTIFGTLEGLNK